MRQTPAQKWAEKCRKAKEIAAAAEAIASADAAAVADMTTTPEGFEALCMAMEQDVHALHGLPVEQKAAFKAERLTGYLEHVTEYEKAGDVYANPVLVESMIWAADLLLDGHPAANAPLFERLALLCIEQGQKLPERFNTRNLPTFVADAVMAWASQKVKLQQSPQPLFNNTFERAQLWPVPKVVLMKYNKLAGQLAVDAEEYETAYTLLTRADLMGTPAHPAKVTTLKKQVIKKLEQQGIALPSVTLESVTPNAGTDTTGTDDSATESAGTDTQIEHPANDAATTDSDASQ